MDLADYEEVVHKFDIPDVEFGSYMATELKKVDAIDAEIAKLIKKLEIMKAQAQYIGGSTWEAFFAKYPGNHPTDFGRAKGVNSIRFDVDSHSVYLIRNLKV